MSRPRKVLPREVKEETHLTCRRARWWAPTSLCVRMNQVIIAYHVVATGDVQPARTGGLPALICTNSQVLVPAGTGYALADWLRHARHEPVFLPLKKTPNRRGWADQPPKD